MFSAGFTNEHGDICPVQVASVQLCGRGISTELISAQTIRSTELLLFRLTPSQIPTVRSAGLQICLLNTEENSKASPPDSRASSMYPSPAPAQHAFRFPDVPLHIHLCV